MDSSSAPQFAALFLDFENIYYYLREEFVDPPNLNDAILELIRNLRHHLQDQFGLDSIISNAYADFERLGSTPQGGLFLLGVDTKNVLGTDHKNAADMRLCIDALEVLYTRPEIQSFVLVTGDRDYIPLIQHLRRKARHVLGAGFRLKASGDLLLNLGESRFIDLTPFLSPATREAMVAHRESQLQRQADAKERMEKQAHEIEERARLAREAQSAPLVTSEAQAPVAENTNGESEHDHANGHSNGHKNAEKVAVKAPELLPEWRFDTPRSVVNADARECLRLILQKLNILQRNAHATELWLGPFKRQLTDAMPQLADWERREVIEELVRAGAIAVEKREGEPYPYSVIVVNYRHPDVWELNGTDES
ncbi:NYN domain-containing protein [bacterium]|nr:MAG: NYN domain-containing protein [bacterium]